jgi:hypothetical protein
MVFVHSNEEGNVKVESVKIEDIATEHGRWHLRVVLDPRVTSQAERSARFAPATLGP